MNASQRLALKLREKKRQSLFFRAGQTLLQDVERREWDEKVRTGKFGLLGVKNVPEEFQEEESICKSRD